MTVKNVNKSRLLACKIPGNFPAIKLATADDKNQNPIMSDAIFLGETFDTIDKPIGERHNSPRVCKK